MTKQNSETKVCHCSSHIQEDPSFTVLGTGRDNGKTTEKFILLHQLCLEAAGDGEQRRECAMSSPHRRERKKRKETERNRHKAEGSREMVTDKPGGRKRRESRREEREDETPSRDRRKERREGRKERRREMRQGRQWDG